MLEQFEHRLEDAWKRTRVARTLCVKGAVGSALLFTGAHFSRCVVLAHTLRGEEGGGQAEGTERTNRLIAEMPKDEFRLKGHAA